MQVRRAAPLLLVAAGAAVFLLAMAGNASAQVNPPVSGDWYISSSTTVSNTQVTITGDITVPSGQTLTLNNVDLRIDSAFPGEHGINVQAGGTLQVSGGTLQAASPSNTYRFEIYGSADIDGALIQYMWGTNVSMKFGVQIYSSSVSITNSTIQHGSRGNVLIDGASPYLANNQIRFAHYMEYSYSVSSTCYIYTSWDANGVLIQNGSHPTLKDNAILDNGLSSSALDPWPQYVATQLSGCSYGSIYEFFLGYGVRVESASAEVDGGTIERSSRIDSPGGGYVVSGSSNIYRYRYTYSWQASPNLHPAGLYLSAADGNYTNLSVNNNFDTGVLGKGGNAVLNHVTIGNHTYNNGPGVGLGVTNGITARNVTFTNNYYSVDIYGTGTAVFENMTFGPQYSQSLPAIYFDYSAAGSVLKIFNTSFPDSTTLRYVIQLSYNGGSQIDFYNCSIQESQVWDPYSRGGSTITAYWIFQAHVTWNNGAPVSSALAMLTNAFDTVVFVEALDANGTTPERWVIGFQKLSGGGGTIVNSPLDLRVYANGTISNPHPFTFNGTTLLEVQIEDPYPPSLAVYYPLAGARFNSTAVAIAGNTFDVGSGVDYVEYSTDGGTRWDKAGGFLPEWRAVLSLPDGVHDIWVRAVDKSGRQTSTNVTGVFVDTIAPTFEIWQPVLPTTPGQPLYTNATSVLLRGTAPADAYLTLNGEFIPVTGGQFSKQLLLQEGFNVYTLAAVDAVENRFQQEFAIVSDTIRPSIFMSSPPENYATNRPTVNVAGVTETDVSLLLNGVPVHVSGGVFSLQYNLSEGINTLRVEARDLAGNTNSLTRAVFFDTVAPSILIEYPTPNLVTSLQTVEIRGSVETTVPTVYIDGAPVQTVKGAFAREVRLDEGQNVITVQAWDSAGNKGETHVVVFVDSDPPELSITSPVYGALVTTTTVNVKGAWTGEATVTVDGVPVLSSDGTIDERVSLLEGPNLIEVVATDAAGNGQQVQVLVYRDTVPPTLSVNLPQTKFRTQLGAYSVTGNVAGGVLLTVNGRPVAVDGNGDFTVLLPLNLGENTFTFTATDNAGNTASSVHTLERVEPPQAPEGLFGMGDASYALLPAMLIAGVVGTFAVLRLGRREE